jgi:chemotaxis protein CheC
MSDEPDFLNETELDALTEIVNIGVSRAAASLRKMVDRQVFLAVPAVEILSRKTAATLMSDREAGPLVAVRQDFTGAFEGRALLIFPEANSLELVRAVTRDELSEFEVGEIEDEALCETGNVVLNNCLAIIANMLQRPLEMSIPVVIRDDSSRLFDLATPATPGAVVLFLYINFAVAERDIRGYIAVVMDLPSLDTQKTQIGELLVRVAGPG